MTEFILPTIFALLVLSGVLLAFVPFFPALSYMLVLAIVYGLADHFVTISFFQYAVLVLITVTSIAVDWSAGVLGARYGGAHSKSLGYGVLAMFIGTLLAPPFGGIICLFVAIFASEMLMHNKSQRQSLRSAGGAVFGAIAGMGINVFLALTFFILFSWFVFF